MKILCVSDQIDPLVYNQNAKKNFADVELVLCAGDLPMDYIDFIVTVLNKPTYFIFGNHNLEEFKFYHKTYTTTEKAATSVQAMATDSLEEKSPLHNHGAIYAGFKVFSAENLPLLNHKNKKTPLLIAGASGSNRYNKGLCQYTNNQMMLKLISMIPKLIFNKLRYGRYLDIFLTHSTPFNIHDAKDPCHIGFKCYNWFLKKFKPLYMIHGHIHLYDAREERIGKYYNTTVVNAYAHCVIDFQLENKKNKQRN